MTGVTPRETLPLNKFIKELCQYLISRIVANIKTYLVARITICIEHDGSDDYVTSYPSDRKSMLWPPPECREVNRKSFSSLRILNKVHVFSLERYSVSLGLIMAEAMVCGIRAQCRWGGKG